MSTRVFISHSARDGNANAVRTAIRDALIDAGDYTVLMDDFRLAPGDAWRSRINLWLGSCDAAVVLLSREALASTYVAFELSVLGYRRWREEREGREFRIIPVLAGVTMEELEASPLRPSQAGEWMAAVAGDDVAAVGLAVANALQGTVPAAARPIERIARVLDAHLPQTEAFLVQAAAALGVELPWDTAESRSFCLALRLLGCGMSIETVKAVRQLRLAPAFQPAHLPAIIDLLSSSWVDLRADDIPELVRHTEPPALALNASFADTAKMYMTSARYRVEPHLICHIAEPCTVIEELGDDDAYRERLVREVRDALADALPAEETELPAALADYALLGEPVVVVIPASAVPPPALGALQNAFPHVTFFLLTGASDDSAWLASEKVYVICPRLAPSDEELCRKQYDDFCRLLGRS